MEILKLAKIAVIVVILLVVMMRIIGKLKNKKDPFLRLAGDNNHQNVLIPGSSRGHLQEIIEAYSGKAYDQYDNLLYKLSEILLDPLPQLIQQPDEREYFKKLNKAQKVFSLAMQFQGQVDNGGVYQFLWNKPHSMYAMREALLELDVEPLRSDFEVVLKELEKNADDFAKDKHYWNTAGASQDDKWQRFQEGRKYIPSGTKIEDYFYNQDFKIKWNQAIVDYVKLNLNQFIAA